MGRDRTQGSWRTAHEARGPHRGRSDGVRAARIAELRQAVERGAQRRNPRDRRCVPLLRGRRTHHARGIGGRVSAGIHQHDPPRSHRRGGVDRAVELSTHDGGLEDGAGARRGQHRSAQAFGTDAAHRAQARHHLRGAVSARRRQHHLRTWQHRGRAAGGAARSCDDFDYRVDRQRRESTCGGGQRHQAHTSRVRRQGTGHRVR